MNSQGRRAGMNSLLMGCLGFFALAGVSSAQPAHQVLDINTSRTGGTDEWVTRSQFVDLAGTVIFSANDGRNGTELWRTDGTAAGTALVRDVCPGVCPSIPVFLTVVGSQVFFTGDDGLHGRELWRTDGTEAGTVMVTDLEPGPAGSNPLPMAELGGKLVFQARQDATGSELWITDGTAAGTTLLADIVPGADSSDPVFLGRLPGLILFSAWTSATGRELWRTDGTPAGTTFVADINPGSADSLFNQPPFPGASYAAVSGGRVFFSAYDAAHGQELWVSDGTPAGTALVSDINPGGGSDPYSLVPFGAGVLFQANDGTHGQELWTSDGTAAGTAQVLDINPGSNSSSPWRLTVAGSHVFFRANDGVHGYELWVTDGTAAGTSLVADIAPGSANGAPIFGLAPTGALGSDLLFYADDGVHGQELWRSDGTAAGTTLLADINPGADSSFFFLGPTDGDRTLVTAGRLYFRAYAAVTGFEVWTSDGTPAGTHQLADIDDQASAFEVSFPGDVFSPPVIGALPGGKALFQADDGVLGAEPWATDGTPGGTHQVADLWPGATGSFPGALTPFNGSVLFEAATGSSFGLWASNGTTAQQLAASSSPAWATPLGSIAVFASPANALWKTDGTPGGTAAVGAAVSLLGPPAPLGSSLFFAGDATGGGQFGLWKTDGSPGGTGLVAGFMTAPDTSGLGPLVPAAGRIFFSAFTSASGRELWMSDGTPAGTVPVQDIRPGAGDGIPFAYPGDVINGPSMAALGSSAVFLADDGVHGLEPWVSDGTPGGTILLADVAPGSAGSNPGWVTAVGGHVFFVADDGVHGRELWATDGTPAGTVLLDLEPGPGSSLPNHLTPVGNVLLFSAWDPAHGRELWVSDGTAAGTSRVQDIAPGALSASPLGITPSGANVYFAANDNTHGFELWTLPRTALGAALSATKTASGFFYEGGTVTYTIVVTNHGLTLQPDAPGPELTDVLPAGLALTGASATAGTVSTNPGTRTVTWNGSLEAGASVTVTITATIQAGTLGSTLANQATLAWDADADGVNEATGVSDDPGAAGSSDPTPITVGPPAFSFYTVTPCRVADTRSTSALSSAVTRTFAIAGSCGVPATAQAVAVNVTIVGPTGDGYLVLWPSGTAVPGTSTVNFRAGATRANNAVLGLAGGALDAQAALTGSGNVHLVIDVSGYFQ